MGALSGGDSVHTLSLAAICWAIWKTWNNMCFEKRVVRNTLEILYSACAFMRYWASLYLAVMKEAIGEGVDLMLQTAIRLLGRKAKVPKTTLAIKDKKTTSHDDDDEM
jgi:hypothetical protein